MKANLNYKDVGKDILTALDSRGMFSGGVNDSVSIGLSTCVAKDQLTAMDGAPSSTNAFLVSELEKRDPVVRKPLTTYTWAQNIPVRTGGGWVTNVSNLNIGYGSAGASEDDNVSTAGADVMPVIQGNFGKDIYKTHLFVQPVSINEFDMLRQNITGRSLDTLLGDGVRLHYEKHMDKNVFVGLSKFGTTGLLNNPAVPASTVAAGGQSSNPTTWASKLKDTNGATEILNDVNNAINYTWQTAGRDMGAIPNHVLLPFDQFNLLISNKVSEASPISILEFLKQNNIVKNFGEELVFGVSLWGKGAGTGGTDRMAVYRHDEKFIAVDELQPLTRMRTVYSSRNQSYDTNYAANISEVEFFYGGATISYWDGI